MHEHAAEILGVLVNAVIERLYVLLIQESKNALLERARAFPRDNFDSCDLLGDCLIDRLPKRAVNIAASVENIVEIQLDPHGETIGRPAYLSLSRPTGRIGLRDCRPAASPGPDTHYTEVSTASINAASAAPTGCRRRLTSRMLSAATPITAIGNARVGRIALV